MSVNYSVITYAGQPARIPLSTPLNLSSYVVSVETDTTSAFAAPSSTHGAVSVSNGVVLVSFTAADVDALQNSYFRVKLVGGGQTYYLATGALEYVASSSSTITPGMVDAGGNIIEGTVVLPPGGTDSTVSDLVKNPNSSVSASLKAALVTRQKVSSTGCSPASAACSSTA